MNGLMTELARRHNLTAAVLIDDEFDADECRHAMQAYCREVVLIQNPYGAGGATKRLVQARSIASPLSFERFRVTVPQFQRALDEILLTNPFDIVNLEFPYLGHYNLRQSPTGTKPPVVIVDSHEIAYDLGRQFARTHGGFFRRLYAEINWRKLKRDELQSYGNADGVYLCSRDDEQRLLAQAPGLRTMVIPNAANVDYLKPRSTDPAPDGRTLVYFGLLSTTPNIDGVIHFVQDIWPRIAEAHPEARFKVIGKSPPPSLLALANPRIEFTGFVDDLRPHLAEAAAVVVPLRLGGGTRLKIVEAMAMGKAIVSTSLGAEGIEALPGRDILIEDEPQRFAEATIGLLSDPARATRIGLAARRQAEERYAWAKAARDLEAFFRSTLETQR